MMRNCFPLAIVYMAVEVSPRRGDNLLASDQAVGSGMSSLPEVESEPVDAVIHCESQSMISRPLLEARSAFGELEEGVGGMKGIMALRGWMELLQGVDSVRVV